MCSYCCNPGCWIQTTSDACAHTVATQAVGYRLHLMHVLILLQPRLLDTDYTWSMCSYCCNPGCWIQTTSGPCAHTVATQAVGYRLHLVHVLILLQPRLLDTDYIWSMCSYCCNPGCDIVSLTGEFRKINHVGLI